MWINKKIFEFSKKRSQAALLVRQLAFLPLFLLGSFAEGSNSTNYLDDYSDYNESRPELTAINYIILHTTEGDAVGALDKLKLYGEAHYLVEQNGTIHRLLEPNKLAFHAGRSMWNGIKNIDELSIGIELEGFHDKPIGTKQELALKDLLSKLQARFKIKDQNVLTHSMVAYGLPNFWYPSPQRGRKRCGMLMALDQVRFRIGLTPLPKVDPDVVAGRLIVGDEWLFALLYQGQHVVALNTTPPANVSDSQSRVTVKPAPAENNPNVVTKDKSPWFIARELYNDPSTLYEFPVVSGTQTILRGDQIKDWGNIPPGTLIRIHTKLKIGSANETEIAVRSSYTNVFEIGKDGETAYSIARSEYDSNTTIYFFPNNVISSGARLKRENPNLLIQLPKGTKIIMGYRYGGKITSTIFVSHLGGSKVWDSPSTLYRLPNGKFLNGTVIKQNQIVPSTTVYFEE